MQPITSVRVILVVGDVTYDIELGKPDDGRQLEGALQLDHEDVQRDNPMTNWAERVPTGNTTIELKAFGRLVKSERRQG